jgi:predicted enzyme related to lactoylglutathione lyase
VLRAAADIPGIGRFAVVADPSGAMLHLFKAATPAQPAAYSAAGHIGWRELHATDWPKAFEFYRALFGWSKGSDFDMGAMGRYQQFTIGGVAAGGMFNSPAAQPLPFWLYYFGVDDIDAATARATAGGGKILNGPHQVPGGGWITQAADPQGARFALLGTRR